MAETTAKSGSADHQVIRRVDDSNHYILIDQPRRVVAVIRALMGCHPEGTTLEALTKPERTVP